MPQNKQKINQTNHGGISIIIIAYNEEKYLPILLESLENQMVKEFEVIVVDSNSIDNTYHIVQTYKERFRNFKYLKLNCVKGPAYSRNRGAEIATYERLLFLDADTRVKTNFIGEIIFELEMKQSDVATCPIRISEENVVSNMGAMFLNLFMIALQPVYSAAYGACLITTKSVHLKLGGFREDLGICEDCNYIKRARRLHNFKFSILSPFFFTSDRRAKAEGKVGFMLKYVRIHLYRMFTGKEIPQGEIKYEYGEF